jgi:hypothetical protein
MYLFKDGRVSEDKEEEPLKVEKPLEVQVMRRLRGKSYKVL